MSTQSKVDVAELLKRIEAVICEPCKQALRKVEIPMTQVMTVNDILEQAQRR